MGFWVMDVGWARRSVLVRTYLEICIAAPDPLKDGLKNANFVASYGVKLLGLKHYVGSILHVYHVLKIYTDFEVRTSSFTVLATSFMLWFTPKVDT